jgi:hypothetical protein
LGGREFPVRTTTGILWQGLDLSHRFCGQTAAIRGKSTKFPARREKPERAAAQLSDNSRLLRRLAIDRPNVTVQIMPHRHIGRFRIVQRARTATFAMLIAVSA